MGSMYAAVLFLDVQNLSLVQPVVAVECTDFTENHWNVFCHTLCNLVVIEIPYAFVQSSFYGVIVYAMIGFEWTVTKFFCVLLCSMEYLLTIHHSTTSYSNMVEIVLLGMPCCMDLVWSCCITIWRYPN